MSNEMYQDIITSPHNLFSLLSREDYLKMFIVARDGLKISRETLNTLGITPKKYYKALKKLKDAGLVYKQKESAAYFHTTFGSVIYQRNIIEIGQYTKYLEKMKMMDTLKKTKEFSQNDIEQFIAQIIGFSNNNNTFLSPSPQSSRDIDIIWSYEDGISKLMERLKLCNNEALIATRMCPESILNELIHKSKLGVKLKVLVHTGLIEEYLKMQNNNDNHREDAHINDNHVNERTKVVENPWYPEKTIDRRIFSGIPFGLIILDEKDVGIELVNCNKPNEFLGSIWIKDQKFATVMKEYYYEKLWNKVSENTR